MKLKHIALAAALAASASSFAAIQPGGGNFGNGDSEMFLTAWDDTAKVSYTFDLGVASSEFRAAADGAVAGYSRSWTVESSVFPSFLAAPGVTLANVRWDVFGYDNVGGATANARSFITTVTNGQGITATAGISVGATTNQQIVDGNNAVDGYVELVNQGVAGQEANYAANVGFISNAPANYIFGFAQPGNNGAGSWPFTTDNALGDSARFVYAGRSGTSGLAKVLINQFDNVSADASMSNVGLFTFAKATGSSNYVLSYALAPVPEPETYTLLLGGLAVVGFVARRRRAG